MSGFKCVLVAFAASLLLAPAAASAQVSPTLKSQVQQLIRYAKGDFAAIRIDSSEKDAGGDYNYRVKGFNACGPKSQYNKVWHWRTMKGNWEYVCDVDFPNEYPATAYYDKMAEILKATPGFRFEEEKVVNGTTRRRLEGYMSNPPLKIMFDYDVADDGSIEIEFWFKQKFNPGPVKSGGGADKGGDGGTGRKAVSPAFVSQMKQLVRYAKGNFDAIRIQNTEKDQGGDVNYRVKGFNACGPKSEYNKVWHWKTMKGNWEYVCDVNFDSRADADAYYNEMKRLMTSQSGWRWEPEKRVNDSTLRRVEGYKTNPPLKIMFDYDKDGSGVEIEFWFKQKFNPGPVKSGGNTTPRPSSGKPQVSPTFKDQVRKLIEYSKSDFSAIRMDNTKRDNNGDDAYKANGNFNACGPQSNYNKVWHWKTFKGNWEYVCDVDFSNRGDADAYYNEMKRQMTSMREFTWKTEQRVNNSTVRRVVGTRDNPPLKIMFDYDVESSGQVEIEFWLKQKFNK